jgi:hypothetical protein
MSGIIRVVAGLEANTMVYYDRKAQKIVANVVGSARTPGAERGWTASSGGAQVRVSLREEPARGSICPTPRSPWSITTTAATRESRMKWSGENGAYKAAPAYPRLLSKASRPEAPTEERSNDA